MAGYEMAIVRRPGWAAGRPTVGLGLLVGNDQVVTCAHVVTPRWAAASESKNRQASRTWSSWSFRWWRRRRSGRPRRAVTVGAAAAERHGWRRRGRASAHRGGAVERHTGPVGRRDTRAGDPATGVRVPGNPARASGAWVDVDLKGEVGGQLIQVESRSDRAAKAQPGSAGHPCGITERVRRSGCCRLRRSPTSLSVTST